MIILIKLYRLFLELVYAPLKLLPTKKQILIISRQSNDKTIDIEVLETALKQELNDYNIKVMTKKIENKIIYFFYIFKLMYHIARSKVVVLDSYCIPISMLKHKKDLKVIQMWHAIGIIKKAGFSSLDKEEGRNRKIAYAMKMHKNYDYAFASSKACIKAMSEVFNMNKENIVVKLLPRVDLLRDKKYQEKNMKDIFLKYPNLKNKKNILYIPTFRKNEDVMSSKVDELINSINYDKYNLIIKMHPNSNIKIEEKNNVYICPLFSSMQMLFVADYVISDYSSIIYEAMILNKPIYFYAFDIDLYDVKRGLFIDYKKEMPGLITSSAKAIINSIEKEDYNYKNEEEFKNKYLDLSKSNNTLDIIDLIKKCL